ncbi:cyclin domain-containing protein [Apiospora kogelbergensis]|uniref:cyclin domain-containing protein n=1 Tax=Apiospora kogelbergensis TaxID=1337665 RepID=UPI00312E3EE1
MSDDHAPGGEAPGPSEDSPKQTTPTSPPPPPIPAADPQLLGQACTPPPLHHASPSPSSKDLFKLTPIAALKLLSGGIEALVRPPPPPPQNPSTKRPSMASSCAARPRPRRRRPRRPSPYVVIGANSQPLNLQHSAITRKFYSKAPPPISIEDYLLRMHRFCPMSTAVYLATSLYIFRLAVEERAIPVTRRNCHRLLLAGLRVAMKALEDLSYPHAKVARVGGVSEVELARLEISFCFLAGFELVVGEETLRRHWQALRDGQAMSDGYGTARLGGGMAEIGRVPVLKLEHRRREVPVDSTAA